MSERDQGEDIELVESIIETRGIEEAVCVAFDSSEADRERLVACLEKACGVRFGADEARWRAWLDELRAQGVVGFGRLPERSRPDLPADPKVISNMILESTGLATGGRRSEGRPSDRGGGDAGSSRLVGSYEIIEKLGEGSMGVVYKARQLSMDRVVAIKLLAGWLSRDTKYVSRFFREAKLAAKLDHPNIVRGIDAGSDAETHYFVMEYVEGESLGRILRAGRRFSEKAALRVAMQIANALAHAWKHGLVHRDVKPDNIILTKGRGVKLADLGLAKSIGGDVSHMTQTGTSVGTPYYMSPEQVRGEREIDVRSDIYSLGATLYHLVTGYTPFAAPTPLLVLNKHLTETPEAAHVRNPNVSGRTSAIIDKMMAKDPAERYADPTELMEDIGLVVKGEEPRHAVLRDGEGRAVTGTDSLIGVVDLEEEPGRPAFAKASAGQALRSFGEGGWAGTGAGWKIPVAAAAGAAIVALALFLAFDRTGGGGSASDSDRADVALRAPDADREAEIRSAQEAVTKARRLLEDARVDEAIAVLDEFLASARFDEARALAETERARLVEEKEKFARLTAADIVTPRREAREAKAEAEGVPAVPEVEESLARVRKLWDRAERALEAGELAKAFVSYQVCRRDAEKISSSGEDIEACVRAAEGAARAREASASLSEYAATEWRVAKAAFQAAEAERAAGEFQEAARGYVAAKGAYEEHYRQAVGLARERALARGREAEKGGNLREALRAYREAARHGADVAGKVSALEETLTRGDAMRRTRSLAERKKWKEAAAELAGMLRRWPGDEEASSLLAKVTEQLRKEPPLKVDLGGGVKMELVYILPGTFKMGSGRGDPDERPVHEVFMSGGFYLGRTEVTQAEYERVVGRNPSYWKDPARPVERVSWQDAVEFCEVISKKTGKTFRLSTEAEWEYAARAGSVSCYCFGDEEKWLGEFAWYASNSGRETHPAGAKKPNAWGLCDVHGNVWEWCADAYSADYYSKSPDEDPKGPDAGDQRVLRGGSWLSKAEHCRSAERIRYKASARYADVGFRVACEP